MELRAGTVGIASGYALVKRMPWRSSWSMLGVWIAVS
jgi:hypothetical protein